MSLRSSRTCCFETLKSIPVIFILAIVAWSYYAYVVQMCICKFRFFYFRKIFNLLFFFLLVTIDNVPKKVIYLLIYHPLLFLFLSSYYRTIFQTLAAPTSEVNQILEFNLISFFGFSFMLVKQKENVLQQLRH